MILLAEKNRLLERLRVVKKKSLILVKLEILIIILAMRIMHMVEN